jgi:hypothetical protein
MAVVQAIDFQHISAGDVGDGDGDGFDEIELLGGAVEVANSPAARSCVLASGKVLSSVGTAAVVDG